MTQFIRGEYPQHIGNLLSRLMDACRPFRDATDEEKENLVRAAKALDDEANPEPHLIKSDRPLGQPNVVYK